VGPDIHGGYEKSYSHKLKERDNFENIDVDGSIIFKHVLEK